MNKISKFFFISLPALTLLAVILTVRCGEYIPTGYPESMAFVQQMGAGWNLGNTLDAHWNAAPYGPNANNPTVERIEGLWGNPATTKAMIDTVKAKGFDTVRVPVTWYIFTGPEPNYAIDVRWMNRVQEVVDYVIDNNMYCIINIHHDDYHRGGSGADAWENGWLRLWNCTEDRALNIDEKAEMKDRLAKIWEQIAERFKDYDEKLIFEGLNEPRTIHREPGNSAAVWQEQSLFLNDLLQVFIDTVRKSGGNNPDRHLMITPYFASVGMQSDYNNRTRHFVDTQNKKLRVNDPRNRLIASLHYYEPWGFAAASPSDPWHRWEYDLTQGPISGNVNNVFSVIANNFTSLGIPVIMGETGAERRDRPNSPPVPEGIDHNAERAKWALHYAGGLKALGVPTIIWDDGGTFRLLNRNENTWWYSEIADALVQASEY